MEILSNLIDSKKKFLVVVSFTNETTLKKNALESMTFDGTLILVIEVEIMHLFPLSQS